VDTAVKAARKAYESWSTTPGHVRARFMYSIARHIQKHHRLLAVLESMDNGKPIRETRDCDIPVVARWFYHYAGWAQVRASAAWAICLCLSDRVVMCSVENKNQITKQKKHMLLMPCQSSTHPHSARRDGDARLGSHRCRWWHRCVEFSSHVAGLEGAQLVVPVLCQSLGCVGPSFRWYKVSSC
jgi:hypothetical protein